MDNRGRCRGSFEGEEHAEDLGGPRLEFLHLLLGALCKDSKTISGMLYTSHVFCCQMLFSCYKS